MVLEKSCRGRERGRERKREKRGDAPKPKRISDEFRNALIHLYHQQDIQINLINSTPRYNLELGNTFFFLEGGGRGGAGGGREALA